MLARAVYVHQETERPRNASVAFSAVIMRSRARGSRTLITVIAVRLKRSIGWQRPDTTETWIKARLSSATARGRERKTISRERRRKNPPNLHAIAARRIQAARPEATRKRPGAQNRAAKTIKSERR